MWQAVLLRRSVSIRDGLAAGAFVLALVAAVRTGVLGLALGGSVLVTAGPQVRRALAEDDLSGIAPATWRVALIDAAAWGAYGWAIGDLALLGYFAVLTASAAIILGCIAWTERGRSLEPPRRWSSLLQVGRSRTIAVHQRPT